MKIEIQVFVENGLRLYENANWGRQRFWDTYGASLAIDNDITSFPKTSFAVPSEPRTGYVVQGAAAEGYFWSVTVPTTTQRKTLKLTDYPTILFYDTEGGRYVGRLEGTPKVAGDVAKVLRSILNSGGASATERRKTVKKVAGLGLLSFLLFTLKSK